MTDNKGYVEAATKMVSTGTISSKTKPIKKLYYHHLSKAKFANNFLSHLSLTQSMILLVKER